MPLADRLSPLRLVTPLRDGMTLLRAGLVRPERADRLARAGLALLSYGVGIGAGIAAGAARFPHDIALVDDTGPLSWQDLETRSNGVAHSLRALGVGPGERAALFARNGRDFVIGAAGIGKTGADTVLLNTALSGEQLAAALTREDVRAVVSDRGLLDLAATLPAPAFAVDELANGRSHGPEPTGQAGRLVVLTSGTTGTPKGAGRRAVADADAFLALIDGMGLHAHALHVVPAPLFHAWGFAGFGLGLAINATLVLHERFDAETVLADIERHQATVLWAVPVMLQRILALPEETIRCYDTSSLRCVAVSGSALPGGLPERWQELFGATLHSVYGSTEVGWATIAAPLDLAADPRTAGRPARGVQVRIVDDDGADVAPGETGRVFVGSALSFEGYTGGTDKQRIAGSGPLAGSRRPAGLVSSGDLGHFDEDGRLMVDGREDDMVITGGENVFPRGIEDVLTRHDDVAEAVVIGVPDDELGQRLVAYVAPRTGAQLDPDELRAWLRPQVARYELPRAVEIVDVLPRNATGKVVVRELPPPS